MPDLLESSIEKAVEAHPRHEEQYVRRRVIVRRRRHTTNPENYYTTELIHTADCRSGIVDGGRNRAQRNVNDLDDTELDILLQGALDQCRRRQQDGGRGRPVPVPPSTRA